MWKQKMCNLALLLSLIFLITTSYVEANSIKLPETPQEAYEEALDLLRSTLVYNKKASSSENKYSTNNLNQQQSRNRQSKNKSIYWDVFKNWIPFTSIFRNLKRLWEIIISFNPFSAIQKSTSSRSTTIRRSPSNILTNSNWQGSNLLIPSTDTFSIGKDPVEELQAFQYPGARPEQLWPEWDTSDDAHFGPFLSTSFQNKVKPAKDNSIFKPIKDYLSNSFFPSWSKTVNTSSRQWADLQREKAEALLIWAAGFHEDAKNSIDLPLEIDWWDEVQSINPERLIDDYLNNITSTTFESPDALWTLAMYSFWGLYGSKPHPDRAKACLERLTTLNGNTSAHLYLGWIEGGAWGNSGWQLLGVNSKTAELGKSDRQARSLMHYQAAAEHGDSIAQMTLAYRYHSGIAVQQSCGAALYWYEKSAKDALNRFQSGPPGGLTLPYTHLRLSDLSGGVFGPGASAASTGLAKHRPAIQAMLHALPADGSTDGRRLEDLLEFFTYHAERGEPGYARRLARIYYDGSILGPSESATRVQRDYKKAREYLLLITKDVWPMDAISVAKGGATQTKSGNNQRGQDIKLKVDDNHAAHAGAAASLLGRMYLRGEGVAVSYVRAWVWFSRGAEQGDLDSYNGLGLMHLHGLGIPKNTIKAVELFEMSTSSGFMSSAEGCVNLGKIYFQLKEYTQAGKQFDMAMKLGNSFEAYYYLALINVRLSNYKLDQSQRAYVVDAPGTASFERCKNAVSGFKFSVERANWRDPTFSRAERAWSKDFESKALMMWSIAGERGYEAAQNNVAWTLDSNTKFGRMEGRNSTDRLALIHWIRSAAQDNVDALVKMGDYYYYGIGVGKQDQDHKTSDPFSFLWNITGDSNSHQSSSLASFDKAAACYSAAAQRQTSALAYWNMAYMYELGLGVPRKDYNLAKRYYDMAYELNKEEAYLPVALSLIKLFVMACWDAIRYQDATAYTLLNSFMTHSSRWNKLQFWNSLQRRNAATADGADNPEDVPYTEADELRIARQRDELARQQQQQNAPQDDAILGDPNLPETYQNLVRQQQQQQQQQAAAPGGQNYGESDDLDATIEGLLIIFGFAALAMLIYVRQGVQLRFNRQRRVEEEENDEQRRRDAPAVGDGQFGWPLHDANALVGL